MAMHMRFLAAACSIFFLANSAFALNQIIRPYQGMRSAGMGGVKITTGEYEENFWGNPARVAFNPEWRITLLDFSFETSTATISNISNLSNATNDNLQPVADTVGDNLHARIQTAMPGFYYPNPGGKIAWSVALLTSTQMDLIARRSYSLEPLTVVDVGPSFSIARRFMPEQELVVGATAHLAYRASSRRTYSLVDVIQGQSFSPTKNGDNGTMIDADIGAMFEFKHWTPHDIRFSAGLAISNLMDGTFKNIPFRPIKSIGNQPRKQPRSLGFGGSAVRDELSLGVTKFRDVVAALEFTDIGNNKNGSIFRTIHIGGEFKWKLLRPRLGLNQGYPSAGLGIDLRFFEIDVATYGEEMSLNTGGQEDRRVALHLAIHL